MFLGNTHCSRTSVSRSKNLGQWIDKHLYILFPLPAFLVLTILVGYPLTYTIYVSFFKWFLSKEISPLFIGFRNYARLFGEPRFWNSLGRSFYFTIYGLIFQLPLGMIIAHVLNRRFIGRGIIRSLFLFPVLATPVAIALIWKIPESVN